MKHHKLAVSNENKKYAATDFLEHDTVLDQDESTSGGQAPVYVCHSGGHQRRPPGPEDTCKDRSPQDGPPQ